ncbi:MAG: hypothetical protein ABSF70_17545 [Terracidiphilus sp.]
MKKVIVAMMILLPALSWAGKEKPKPNPADYTVAVHVQSSNLISICQDSWGWGNPGGAGNAAHCVLMQHLNALVNGKKYELIGSEGQESALRIGDYKAKGDDMPYNGYEYHITFEFLLPDGTTRIYRVIGESE